mmetsp:Transcript_7378/g.21965  ORF Transcript_7378/g.21965 Transcript_7378/m.21965 type:complete len:253 (+) Transcript_7378:442-1200(+)
MPTGTRPSRRLSIAISGRSRTSRRCARRRWRTLSFTTTSMPRWRRPTRPSSAKGRRSWARVRCMAHAAITSSCRISCTSGPKRRRSRGGGVAAGPLAPLPSTTASGWSHLTSWRCVTTSARSCRRGASARRSKRCTAVVTIATTAAPAICPAARATCWRACRAATRGRSGCSAGRASTATATTTMGGSWRRRWSTRSSSIARPRPARCTTSRPAPILASTAMATLGGAERGEARPGIARRCGMASAREVVID